MDKSVLIKIFEESETKEINITLCGKFALQFNKVKTEVIDEGNGTISVYEPTRKCATYIDSRQVSSVWESATSERTSDNNNFID